MILAVSACGCHWLWVPIPPLSAGTVAEPLGKAHVDSRLGIYRAGGRQAAWAVFTDLWQTLLSALAEEGMERHMINDL